MNNRYFIYLFLSSENRAISKASGWEYHDEISEHNKKYVYKAFINGFEDSISHSGTQAVETQFIPGQCRAAELRVGSLGSTALLSWNHTDYDEVFVSYDLERAEAGDTLNRIMDAPLVYNKQTRLSDTVEGGMYHVDSLKRNGVIYHYRLVAHDYFDISSEPSNVIQVEGKDLTAPPAPENLRAQPTRQGVEIV